MFCGFNRISGAGLFRFVGGQFFFGVVWRVGGLGNVWGIMGARLMVAVGWSVLGYGCVRDCNDKFCMRAL